MDTTYVYMNKTNKNEKENIYDDVSINDTEPIYEDIIVNYCRHNPRKTAIDDKNKQYAAIMENINKCEKDNNYKDLAMHAKTSMIYLKKILDDKYKLQEIIKKLENKNKLLEIELYMNNNNTYKADKILNMYKNYIEENSLY